MRTIKDIRKYIDNTNMPAELSDRYEMAPEDLIAIVDASKGSTSAAAMLAFTYGKAKGYRAGRAEARHG